MAVNPLIRYNEIQKALSSFRKESGVKFKASFQQTASQIYQSTKGDPLKYVIQNIDINYKNIIPELPLEALSPADFYDYEPLSRVLPENIQIRSTQLHGEEWSSNDPEYQIVFKDFTDYCNKNRGVFWDSSDDAPRFQFSELDFDDLEGIYYTELSIDRDDAYGYEPGMGAYENKEVLPSEPREEEEIAEPEVEPEIEKPSKKADREFEIRKLQAETEKTKASASKLTELNKAVANLRSDLKDKLITKKQYSKMLEQLYNM